MAPLGASNILIFGATGFIGTFITDKIIAAQPAFNHITIFTSTNTANTKGDQLDKWRRAGNVTVVTGNVESEADVSAAYRDNNIDTVVSAFGRGALAKQVDLIRWADQSGRVKWFFPSEYGTDIEYGPQSAGERPHQQKLKVRKFIRDEVRNLQVTYVVTGPYFESWVGRPGGVGVAPGFDVQKKEAWLVEADGRIGFTTMPDVGKLVVAALRHPEAAAGRALKVNSFEATPNQVLAEYEKQTGARWTAHHVRLDELRHEEKKQWDEGNAAATVLTLRRIWAEGGTLYEKTDNGAIGVKPGDTETLEVILKRILEAQQ